MNFDLNKLSGEDAKQLVKSLATGFQATIQNQQVSSEKLISTLVLDLSVERTRNNPLKISFPFISVRVEEATDINANCRIIPVSIDSYQDDTLLKLNDSLEFDNGISNVFITNTAQANKKMVLKFYTQARVRSGSLVLDQNSTPTEVLVGYGTGQNDGFTFVLEAGFTNAPAGGAVNTIGRFGSNNNFTFNDISNVATIGGFPFSKQFKVPVGYTAEIIGSEIEVRNVLPNGVTCLVAALQNNGVYAAATDAAQLTVSNFGDNFKTAVTLTEHYKYHATNSANFSPFGSTNRNRNVFYENELIVPLIYSMAGVGGACNGIFRIMIRLTKNVGA